MDKGELLQESVKKLLSLGVSDDEIAESLAEVGVAKPDALKLINEVRAGAIQKQPTSPNKTFETTAKELGGVEKPAPQQTKEMQVQQPVQEIQKTIPAPKTPKEINPLEVDFGIEMKESSNASEPKIEEQSEDMATQITAQTTAKKKTKPTSTITPNKEITKPVKQPVQKPVSETVPKLEMPGVAPVPKEKPVKVQEAAQPVESVEAEPSESSVIADKILAEVSKAKTEPTVAVAGVIVAEKTKEKKEAIKLSDVKQSDIEELWKKGIVIAINAKLDEMRKLKDDIDDEIGGKVDKAVKKETNQFKVLLDSQKDLIISSNKEALAEKQKEITFIIDSKIVELKKYNREIEENMRLIQQTKVDQERVMKELNETMNSVKKTKNTLVMEMNSELIKSKSQAQEFVDKSEKHIKEMDERINKTLELEKNIAEGMLEKAEQKIEDMTITRADDLIQELQIELNKVKAVEKSVSIETLDDKIKTLDKFKSEFLSSMQGNLTKINEAIEKLNSKNDNVEKELKGRMLIFDAKIEELTKFEKEFGKTMETYLEKDKK